MFAGVGRAPAPAGAAASRSGDFTGAGGFFRSYFPKARPGPQGRREWNERRDALPLRRFVPNSRPAPGATHRMGASLVRSIREGQKKVGWPHEPKVHPVMAEGDEAARKHDEL